MVKGLEADCSFTEEREPSTFFKAVTQAESDFRNDSLQVGAAVGIGMCGVDELCAVIVV
jgi:hypothetical protein